MSEEIGTPEKIEEILQSENLEASFEALSLALSIRDEEDRDWHLQSIVGWLIRHNEWQKALGIANLMSENYEKSEALQTVARHLASTGHLEKAFAVFDEAEKTSVSKNLSEWQQAELLHKIAGSLYRINAVFKADEIWEKAVVVARKGEESISPQDSIDSSSVLAEIAEIFAAQERIEKALEIAQKIKSVGKKERALAQIAEYSSRIKSVA